MNNDHPATNSGGCQHEQLCTHDRKSRWLEIGLFLFLSGGFNALGVETPLGCATKSRAVELVLGKIDACVGGQTSYQHNPRRSDAIKGIIGFKLAIKAMPQHCNSTRLGRLVSRRTLCCFYISAAKTLQASSVRRVKNCRHNNSSSCSCSRITEDQPPRQSLSLKNRNLCGLSLFVTSLSSLKTDAQPFDQTLMSTKCGNIVLYRPCFAPSDVQPDPLQPRSMRRERHAPRPLACDAPANPKCFPPRW